MSRRRWHPWHRRPAASPSGLTCREAVEIMTNYLEGAMGAGDRARFEAHLAACDGCTAYVQQLRETIAVTGRVEPPPMDPHLERALLEAFRDWKDGG